MKGPLARIRALEGRLAALKREIATAHREEAVTRKELREAVAHQAHVDHAQPSPRDGIDYAWGRPHPARIRASGATFVVRYLGGSASKDLTRGEAENLAAAGLDVAVIWEAGGQAMLGGYNAGARDAKAAAARGHAIGVPSDRPIYFACDFDAEGSALESAHQYVRGAVDVLGWRRVGVYGGISLVRHLHALNACRFYWQTLAWSGGRWHPAAQLRQIIVGRQIDGVEVDIDRAVAADFGQWRA